MSVSAHASHHDCSNGESDCTLGIFPHLGVRQMEATYSSLAEDLSLLTDRPFRFVTASSLSRFEQKLAAGRYDLALIGSPQLLNIGRAAGYVPIARRADLIRFHLLSLSSGDIKLPADLVGKRLGHTSKNTATYLVTHEMLEREGVDSTRLADDLEFGKQVACANALLTNLVDACTVASPVLEQIYLQFGTERFHVVSSSREFPNAIYLAHRSLDKRLFEQAQTYLANRPGFVRARIGDYAAFEALMQP